jgi:RNA 2',3'-cyclic 3'-phosphodiesterase
VYRTSESTWRVFCAIEIPENIRQRIAQHAQQLHQALPDAQASWTKPDNIHLTLKFFGNISQPQVLKVSEAAARAVDGLRPFTIHIEGAGSFPQRGPAKVLWIGISDPTGKLIQLQQKFESECEREGFPKEARAFHPHLTVARLRTARGARAFAEQHKQLGFESWDVSVSSLILFRSELSSKGSTYTRISTHRLG